MLESEVNCSRFRLADFRSLFYARRMRQRGSLYRLRSALAARLGISSEQASDGAWWEIDLILAILAGAIALAIFAWLQL